jgi:hypothetical protein
VLTGLATGFFLDGPKVQGRDLTDAEKDAIVARMVDDRTLTRFSMLQYWESLRGYNDIRNRKVVKRDGHSPVFLWVVPEQGNATGIEVIDQYGRNRMSIEGAKGHRLLGRAQIWIAAEWAE